MAHGWRNVKDLMQVLGLNGHGSVHVLVLVCAEEGERSCLEMNIAL